MKNPFTDDEWDLHGFHDDRKKLIVDLASRIASGIVSNSKMFESQKDLNGTEARQVIADVALDITLKILGRLSTEPPGGKKMAP